MNGRTHLTVGLAIGAVASANHNMEAIPVILAVSGIASLAPDLDGNNLLNKRVTKTAKWMKEGGVFLAVTMIVLSFIPFFFHLDFLTFLDGSKSGIQNRFLILGLGAVILGLSFRSQETLKNLLMSIIGVFLLYYGATNGIGWLVLFALYIGGVGWFPHRGPTHTVWASIYWWYMSHLLEVYLEIDGLALISAIAYLSHIAGDMLTKQGVKFLSPLTDKVFRFRI